MAGLLHSLGFLQAHKETIGFWAAGLTTASFAPQLVQSWRNGGQGLSWFMLLLFGGGVGMWLLFGLLLDSGPVVVANALTGLEVLFLVWLKLRHARVRNQSASAG